MGPGVGMGAGPATDSAEAMTLPPSAWQFEPMDGYMKSWVGGASGPNPALAVGAAAGPAVSAPGAAAGASAAGAGAVTAASGAAGTASGAAGTASGAFTKASGPTDLAGSIPVGRCATMPGAEPAVGTCSPANAASGGDCTNCATESAT